MKTLSEFKTWYQSRKAVTHQDIYDYFSSPEDETLEEQQARFKSRVLTADLEKLAAECRTELVLKSPFNEDIGILQRYFRKAREL